MKFYLLHIEDDVHPVLHGPYGSELERDQAAKKLRREEEPEKHGIYTLTTELALSGDPFVDSYSGGFFEE
jgi:hypothetical protein